jgi:hypothetical protein
MRGIGDGMQELEDPVLLGPHEGDGDAVAVIINQQELILRE